MESDDILGAIGSFLGGIFGGSKAKKQAAANAAALQALSQKVDVLTAQATTEKKWIYFLILGIVFLGIVVFVFVMRKRRR